jgi:hypothetical protein
LSGSQQEDLKRRRRARFVDALTAATRQPDSHSRTGTKIAGGMALLALVAGGVLGLGAWRSYHHGRTENAASTSLENVRSSPYGDPSPTAAWPYASRPPVAPDANTADPSGSPTPQPLPTTALSPSDPNSPSDPKVRSPAMQVALARTLLQNAKTKRCAAKGAGKAGSNVNQSNCGRSSSDQMWTVKVAHPGEGPGHKDLLLIDNANDGLCMDLPTTHAVAAGTKVTQSRCDSSKRDNQLWWISTQHDGKQLIHNYASKSACLQIGKQKTPKKTGLPLRVGTCAVGYNNRWQFAR